MKEGPTTKAMCRPKGVAVTRTSRATSPSNGSDIVEEPCAVEARKAKSAAGLEPSLFQEVSSLSFELHLKRCCL